VFGWNLLRDVELQLRVQVYEMQLSAVRAELEATKVYVGKCERLIEHEREQIDKERERADRIADSLFQSQGLAPTSVTVVREQKAADEVADGKRTDYMAQLAEIYGETESELVEDGAEPVPEPIAELVKNVR